LNRLFPTPQALCDASGDDLGALGIVKQRQRAIQALARAWVAEPALLKNALNVVEALAWLKSIPGIGDWTAQYIAMRALRWPDAFPAGDVALQRALGVRDTPQAAKAALAVSVAWQPWRSYATIRAWDTLSTRPGTLAQTDTLQT
jgi:AraC family transcriptional regulator of adaptative response / DNA-3-methyladenine glycosylase II